MSISLSVGSRDDKNNITQSDVATVMQQCAQICIALVYMFVGQGLLPI